MMKIKKGRGYVYAIQYHIVWCVKYRKNIISGALEDRLKEILLEQSHTHEFTIVEMETDGDHLHMLIECSPQHYIPNIMKALKGNSARYLFKEFPELKKQLWGGHLWNPSYFICTVSDRTEEQITTYIQEQQVKPRKRGRPKDR
ncbi:IS200/IS605 family transposase [Bacillus sp. FJAT-52991]|uniref:IS200/IS605 family transposase n=1 Tax=Bacillus kandeliae TaxID=3129297 RepID=A0ABZ2NBG1_9BACI